MVLDRSDETHDVYDFQVEGTSNFFADGLLVHNCLIIDDPIKSWSEAYSQTYREATWDWWLTEASSRLAPGAPAILILTRWHHDDLAGRLLSQGDGWELLNIPARAVSADDPLGREPGQYMDSARSRTPAQWAKREREAGPLAWGSLYQGDPTPDTGNILPSGAWGRYASPQHVVREDGSCIVPGLTEDSEMVQSWDFTFKGESSSDFVVGQVWLRRGVDVYLLDQVRARMGFSASCDALLAMTAKWPQATAKLIEDKANGPAIMNALRSRVGGLVPVEPEGSKEARAHAISPLVYGGNVYLPEPELAPWVGDLIVEAKAFPAGPNDDQVDALTQAIHRLLLVPIGAEAIFDEGDVLGPDADLGWFDLADLSS